MTTIQLSDNGIKTFYLSSITEKHKDKLFDIKNTRDKDAQKEAFDKLSLSLDIYCEGILRIGEVTKAKATAISPYVQKFLGKDTSFTGRVGDNREIHYRNYGLTYEEQLRTSWLLIHCSADTISAKTALQQMDEKWCVVWEIDNVIDFRFKKKMHKLIDNKKWYRKTC